MSVVLVSTMHHCETADPESGKQENIEFYNITKEGANSLDQKCTTYSCGIITRRWPLAVFYAILDIAGVNARVLHEALSKCGD